MVIQLSNNEREILSSACAGQSVVLDGRVFAVVADEIFVKHESNIVDYGVVIFDATNQKFLQFTYGYDANHGEFFYGDEGSSVVEVEPVQVTAYAPKK